MYRFQLKICMVFGTGVALIMGMAHADATPSLILNSMDGSTIISSGPSNFVNAGPTPDALEPGDAAYAHSDNALLLMGSWNIVNFSSITSFPTTQGFVFSAFGGSPNDNETLNGTIDWTGVENYPTFPELVGTLTVDSVFGQILPSDPFASELTQFVADFPVGSIWSIDVQLEPSSPLSLCEEFTLPSGSICLGVPFGEVVALAPEPATLPTFAAAIGIWLMARNLPRRARRRS